MHPTQPIMQQMPNGQTVMMQPVQQMQPVSYQQPQSNPYGSYAQNHQVYMKRPMESASNSMYGKRGRY